MFVLEGFALIRARAGPIRAHMGPYGLKKSKKVHAEFALIGAFKGPVTLP